MYQFKDCLMNKERVWLSETLDCMKVLVTGTIKQLLSKHPITFE